MISKDSLKITITKDNWKQQWKGQRESILSLESGLHFGHYIAGCNSNHIAYFHALKSTLVIKRGIVLDRWSRGLSVMLEKLLGCALTTKLRSILLMEADFYSTNKIIYDQRMLQVIRNYLSRTQKSSNQNLLYQEMSTRSGSNLILCIPINFYSYVITYTS